MDTQIVSVTSERRDRYLVTAQEALAAGDASLAQKLLQLAVQASSSETEVLPGPAIPTATKPVKQAGKKRGKPNHSGGNHPLAEKVRAWVETQRFVTTPALIAHFSTLKGVGGQYQANKLLQWLEAEGVVSAGNKRAGRAVLANVSKEEADEGRPSVPTRTRKPRKVKAPKAVKAKAKAKKAPRVRRTNQEIQQVGDQFFEIVKSNPGQRMEQLRSLIGMTAHDLMKPVAVLVEQGLIRTEGDKRGMTYFPTDGRKTRKKASSSKRAMNAANKPASRKPKTPTQETEPVTDSTVDSAAIEAVGARVSEAPAEETTTTA